MHNTSRHRKTKTKAMPRSKKFRVRDGKDDVPPIRLSPKTASEKEALSHYLEILL